MHHFTIFIYEAVPQFKNNLATQFNGGEEYKRNEQ